MRLYDTIDRIQSLIKQRAMLYGNGKDERSPDNPISPVFRQFAHFSRMQKRTHTRIALRIYH